MAGVELVGLGLTIAATLDICLRSAKSVIESCLDSKLSLFVRSHGERLVRTCASVRNAEDQIAERVVMVESYWKRTTLQLDFLQRVWPNLNKEHQLIQEQILHVLSGKLTSAVSKIENLLVVNGSRTLTTENQTRQQMNVKRFKYAAFKESLDRAIRDLETWQKLFDPSWFLILLTSSSNIDTNLTECRPAMVSSSLSCTQPLRNTLQGNNHLQKGITLRPDALGSADVMDVPFSSAKVAQRYGSSRLMILDSVPYTAYRNMNVLPVDIRNLAQRLVHADPLQFGLLECEGVFPKPSPSDPRETIFTFVFKAVIGSSAPQSLRALLLAGEADHSLSDRLSIAKDLAKSVSFVHTFGFVHKNIRPENILLSTSTSASLGSSYLVGFEAFRNAEGHTLRRGDDSWERNLYRHPRRQGASPDEYYIMQHDICSLGVCLLELGLWESFVLYNDFDPSGPSPTLLALSENQSVSEAASTKDVLVSLAWADLPKRMGSRYARVVQTCLTCLDEDNVDFGDESEFQDADGVLVGVRYVEKVSLRRILLNIQRYLYLQVLLELSNISM